MRGMIFCAGVGSRLRPFTDEHPKALYVVGGKPLLGWQLELLYRAGIREVVVNVHHFADQIEDYLRGRDSWCLDLSGMGMRVELSDERDCLLDTGGGLWRARDLLRGENVLACNVDILSTIDICRFVGVGSSLLDSGKVGVLVVSERKTSRYLVFDGSSLCGWTNIASGECRPRGIDIGSKRLLGFSGMQLLGSGIFDVMQEMCADGREVFSLIDLYVWMCSRGSYVGGLCSYEPCDYRMIDVGKTSELDSAELFVEKFLKKNL